LEVLISSLACWSRISGNLPTQQKHYPKLHKFVAPAKPYAGRLVARVDRHGSAGAVSSNAGNKHLVLADRHFEHFNPSHSRLQTNTALKFAPEIGSLVGAI
jgi:hypothetical protein